MTPEERRLERLRTWKSKKIRLRDDQDAFDRDYWATVPPAERMAYCWTLFCRQAALQGVAESELRLDRSVAVVKRR